MVDILVLVGIEIPLAEGNCGEQFQKQVVINIPFALFNFLALFAFSESHFIVDDGLLVETSEYCEQFLQFGFGDH